MEKINKLGQSHVEIIVSFVIFIGFLIFIFIFLNPFAKSKETNYIIDNAQTSIINNISDEVGKMSVITNDSISCYDFSSINYPGNYTEISEGNGKYTIYFNKIFNNHNSKKACLPLNYTLGVYSEEEIVIEENIKQLKANYEGNYDDLKKSLGITNEFAFKTKNLAGNPIDALSVIRDNPKTVDVYSREIPIRVINSSGDIRELMLNIRVW